MLSPTLLCLGKCHYIYTYLYIHASCDIKGVLEERTMEQEQQTRGRGRPSKFDRNDLVETVMHKFWEEGYNNVSFNEIAQDAGLTRASLYHSFGSKDELFLLTLQAYASKSPDRLLHNMPDGLTVGAAFFQMFDEACKIWATDKKNRGCFFTNSLNELLATDLPVKDELLKMMARQKKLINGLMKKAISNGELPEGVDVKTLTNLMISFMHGFSTLSKTGIREKDLRSLFESFLAQMGFQR